MSNYHNHNRKSNYLNGKHTALWILLFGFLLQIGFFIAYQLIGDVHVDEAMLLLNARSLVDNGTDILGEKTPIYFDTWLYGGQSPLATYLAALFIKIFGYKLWISRLPILICSMAGLVAVKGFTRELFPKNGFLQNIILLVSAIEPWRLFQGAWTLDCAYFPYMMLFGMYFLAKAVNGKQQILNLILSMVFFALGFYAYIASALLIPIFLLLIFIMLLAKKKIKFSRAVISAVALAVVSLPFILFGLVQTGIIDSVSLGSLTIEKMQYYARGDTSTVFGKMGDASAFFAQVWTNISGALFAFIMPDNITFNVFADASNGGIISAYSYSHIVGGALATVGFGIFCWITNGRRKRVKCSNAGVTDSSVCFIRALIITFFIYSVLVLYSQNAGYRYAAFYPLFHIFEGLCIYQIFSLSGENIRKAVKTLIPVCIVLSVALTSFTLARFSQSSNPLYMKSFSEVMKIAEENDCDKITFVDCENQFYRERESVFIRFYQYDNLDEIQSLETELLKRGALSSGKKTETRLINIKNDGSWCYDAITSASDMTEDCYIFCDKSDVLDDVDKNVYEVHNTGLYTICVKK